MGTSAYFCATQIPIFWPSVYCCADLHMAAFVSLLVTGLVESDFSCGTDEVEAGLGFRIQNEDA